MSSDVEDEAPAEDDEAPADADALPALDEADALLASSLPVEVLLDALLDDMVPELADADALVESSVPLELLDDALDALLLEEDALLLEEDALLLEDAPSSLPLELLDDALLDEEADDALLLLLLDALEELDALDEVLPDANVSSSLPPRSSPGRSSSPRRFSAGREEVRLVMVGVLRGWTLAYACSYASRVPGPPSKVDVWKKLINSIT